MNNRPKNEMILKIATFISHNSSDKNVNSFCNENNIELIATSTNTNLLKLLKGHLYYLAAREIYQTDLHQAAENYSEAYRKYLHHRCKEDDAVKDSRNALKKDISHHKQEFQELLNEGKSCDSYQAFVHSLFFKMDEITDTAPSDVLKRLDLLKEEINQFQTKFGNKANLFSAFLYGIYAGCMQDQLISYKEVSKITFTESEKENNDNDLGKSISFFYKNEYQTCKDKLKKGIEFCKKEAVNYLESFKHEEKDIASINKILLETHDIYSKNNDNSRDLPKTESPHNMFISDINTILESDEQNLDLKRVNNI